MVVRGDEGQAIGEEKESCNWVGEEKVCFFKKIKNKKSSACIP